MDIHATDLPHLNAMEARILGCLLEKEQLTPDVYPLSVNSLHTAANQKTSREPVMSLDSGDIHRTLKMLEEKGLARRVSGSRVDRYEQMVSRKFSLTKAHSALLALLLLRGPQTANELMMRTERMTAFASPDALRTELDMMIGRRPPLVKDVGRAPGQREGRFAHLLSGDVDVADLAALSPSREAAPSRVEELEQRLRTLEEDVEALKARLDAAGA